MMKSSEIRMLPLSNNSKKSVGGVTYTRRPLRVTEDEPSKEEIMMVKTTKAPSLSSSPTSVLENPPLSSPPGVATLKRRFSGIVSKADNEMSFEERRVRDVAEVEELKIRRMREKEALEKMKRSVEFNYAEEIQRDYEMLLGGEIAEPMRTIVEGIAKIRKFTLFIESCSDAEKQRLVKKARVEREFEAARVRAEAEVLQMRRRREREAIENMKSIVEFEDAMDIESDYEMLFSCEIEEPMRGRVEEINRKREMALLASEDDDRLLDDDVVSACPWLPISTLDTPPSPGKAREERVAMLKRRFAGIISKASQEL